MKELRDAIKSKTFQNVYLLYGEERFLIDVYIDRIVESVFKGQDKMMNYDKFDQDTKDFASVINSLDTLPFFADKRVVVLYNMGLFDKKKKTQTDMLTEALNKIQESVICIIAEASIDKRGKLYKVVNKLNGTYEFGFMDMKELSRYIAGQLKKSNLKISTTTCSYLIDTVGYELNNLNQEVLKLIDYCQGKQIVEISDINEVCTKHMESKIFELVDSVGLKKRENALKLYGDMMAMKEPPTRVLFMIARQVSLLYQAKIMAAKRETNQNIAKALGVPPFVAKKLVDQSNRFDSSLLKRHLKALTEVEYKFKQGRIDIETGLELLIIEMSV